MEKNSEQNGTVQYLYELPVDLADASADEVNTGGCPTVTIHCIADVEDEVATV